MKFTRLFVAAISLAAISMSSNSNASVVPPNDLHLEDNPAIIANMTEDEFDDLIDEVKDQYSDIISDLGGRLKVEKRWDDSQVNAFARREKFGKWVIAMFGGLARRPEVTKDAFQLVVCHEIGHHVAGFPFAYDWAANEGQSDFFASHVCAKKIWGNDLAENAAHRQTVDATAKEKCDTVYSNEAEQDLCYRTAMAGKSLSKLLGVIKRLRRFPEFDTPDPRTPSKTNHKHPTPQCRLDTMFAGALCDVKFNDDVIPQTESESNIYSCSQFNPEHELSARPRCWFNQESE